METYHYYKKGFKYTDFYYYLYYNKAVRCQVTQSDESVFWYSVKNVLKLPL